MNKKHGLFFYTSLSPRFRRRSALFRCGFVSTYFSFSRRGNTQCGMVQLIIRKVWYHFFSSKEESCYHLMLFTLHSSTKLVRQSAHRLQSKTLIPVLSPMLKKCYTEEKDTPYYFLNSYLFYFFMQNYCAL